MSLIDSVFTAKQYSREVRELLEDKVGKTTEIEVTGEDPSITSITVKVLRVTLTSAICATTDGGNPAIVSLGNPSEEDTKRPTIVVGRHSPT
ncbi:MAG: hypothetical protein ABI716_03495 [Candidatus Saccharibacteria bacterium]